ncbi:MAG: phosphoglycerate dehydrogenase [Nitrospinota bacterium]|jgi:D-3-phosphoglycerate dehydrogenase|nr:phosphoglycerate dehydrogenase [Nitrospinota bacterium]MDP7369420.1 phosphoglycerate dehydrogenase [Nitrospinota bacterium]MDP7503033.1 phosphoglycerate dehydrogenase [Nitrospinota bacterium]MDP7663577.1 phosphoglycerate dehydrogenase [Nitrospinota bacterium]HJP14893.1 phosphoglycerate dehydrogenase [Nitrospinota bacterium]
MNDQNVSAPGPDQPITRTLISPERFGQIDPFPVRMLEESGVECVFNPHGRLLNETDMKELITGCDSIIGGAEPISAAVMDCAPELRFISRCSVGLDSVDLLVARQRGIPVSYVAGANAVAVTELTVGHVLSLIRGVKESDTSLRDGAWVRVMGRSLDELTVGIIGVGRIGKLVAGHLAAFGAKIIANDLVPDEAIGEELGIEWIEKERLFREADVVCLHVPVTPLTRNVVSREALATMKPDAVLINTARGGLIDEGALAEALRSGRLGGAALDVFEREPYEGELTQIENCILTCHMGASSRSSRLRMEIQAAENLLCFLKGEPVPLLVPDSEYDLQALTAQ